MKDALGLTLGALLDIPFESRSPMQREAITAAREALAQPDYRAVKTYHEGKPVYVSQPEQEPVAWEQFYPDIGKPQLGQEPVAFSCLRCVTPKKCAVHGCSPNTWPSEFSPKRPWVGLTNNEIEDCMEMSIQKTCRAIEAKLKEKNT